MNALDAVKDAARTLEIAGVPSPRNDAEILVADVLGTTRSALYVPDGRLSEEQVRRLESLLDRRRAREPLAYILGEWGFRRLTLAVDPRVLIPRPETEIVVERCLELLRRIGAPRVLDVGTGSGAIALAIADEHPGARVCAVDKSEDALAVARANAERTGLRHRIRLLPGDLLAWIDEPYDLVVSNPPYVEPDEFARLQPEIREWEPQGALVGRGIGEELARDARQALKPGGSLVLECGDGQAPALAAELSRLGYEGVRTTRDLAGKERVVEGRL